jgi:hypothetical protein
MQGRALSELGDGEWIDTLRSRLKNHLARVCALKSLSDFNYCACLLTSEI